MDQDVRYRYVMFKNAGYNSTKFFSSLELLITTNRPTNKQASTKNISIPECPSEMK